MAAERRARRSQADTKEAEIRGLALRQTVAVERAAEAAMRQAQVFEQLPGVLSRIAAGLTVAATPDVARGIVTANLEAICQGSLPSGVTTKRKVGEVWHREPRNCEKGDACKPWIEPRHWLTEVDDAAFVSPTPDIQAKEQTRGPGPATDAELAELEALRAERNSERSGTCIHGHPEAIACPECETAGVFPRGPIPPERHREGSLFPDVKPAGEAAKH